MALNLVNLVNDYNGAILLEPGVAEFGFVDPQWYLALPVGHTLPAAGAHVMNTNVIDGNLNGPAFLKANYHRLVAANALGNADKALLVTLLRYRYATVGILDSDEGRRGVVTSEYSNAANLGANWDDNANNIPVNANATSIAQFAKRYGDTILHIMVYVFCSRGHHWQPEYDALYNRLLAANNILRPVTWNFPTNEELFRHSLHCLGMRIPLEYTLWCRTNARMTNPMRLRFTPHAPIAGAAQILTCGAVLREMTSEGWWGAFYNRFQVEITAIRDEMTTIAQHPYEYHVASRILTAQPKRDLTVAAVNAFNAICQLCLGYIDHLGRRHALAGQQVITMKSGGPKALAESFSRACDRLGRPSVEGVTMVQFITNL